MNSSPTDLIDSPIRSKSDDLLNRGPFVSLISKVLLTDNKTGGSILGLTGSWGSGKSSVAELVIERLNEEGADIVRFDPWMINSRETLVQEFFHSLGSILYPSTADENNGRAERQRFYSYAKKMSAALSIGLGAASAFIPALSILQKAVEQIGALSSIAEGSLGETPTWTLSELRDEVKKDLVDREKPVIVVIDDLDRLTEDEIRLVLQMLKACADFPNVKYLLLYDRTQVLGALRQTMVDPEAFLEKIVNNTYDLPLPTSTDRERLLSDHLTQLGFFDDKAQSESLGRLQILFEQVLLPGLTTVRQIKRFANSLRSIAPNLYSPEVQSIDPADLLALEFLRQFAPKLYDQLREESLPKIGGRFRHLMDQSKIAAELESQRKSIILEYPPRLQELAQLAADGLFKDDFRSLQNKRFSSEFWRPAYLGYHGQYAAIPEQEWQSFLSRIKSESDLPDLEHLWVDAETRSRWVTAIIGRAEEISWSNSITLLSMVMSWGDRQGPGNLSLDLYAANWEYSTFWICKGILAVTPDELDPVNEFSKAMSRSGSLISAGYVLSRELRLERKNEYDRWSRGYDLRRLVVPFQSEYKKLMNSDRFWDLPDIGVAFSTAYYLLGEAEWSTWFDGIAGDSDLLVKFVNKYLTQCEAGRATTDRAPLYQAVRNMDISVLTEEGSQRRLEFLRNYEDRQVPKQLKRRYSPS